MQQPLVVYRYFDEAKYADAMTQGSLRISTLERCRAYENEHQGDALEGTQTYLSGSIVGGSDDAAFVEIARRSGIEIGADCSNISVVNCASYISMPDAYILSTAIERNDELFLECFGQFCVEIVSPALFFRHISSVLSSRRLIDYGSYGPVIYRNRNYTGLEKIPPMAFVKPAVPYAQQREFRFAWNPVGTCEPADIVAPKIRELCRRVA